MENYYCGSPDELMHYGVLGMKWGVRRYRNSGGSYTKEGLKRFDKSYEDYQSKNNAAYIVNANSLHPQPF